MDDSEPFSAETYYKALGQFIHLFAEIEVLLQLALQVSAGTSRNVSNAIFSGVRVDQAKSFITRLREVNGLPENQMLKRAFERLTIITRIRNDIAHYGAQFASDGPTVSTTSLSMPGRGRETLVSPEVLDSLSLDLNTIRWSIIYVIFLNEGRRGTNSGKFKELADAPWRYKST